MSWRDPDDGFKKKGSGVDYTAVVDRQVGDKRFERERAHKINLQQKGVATLKEATPAVSATFDAFQRMAAGKEGRKIADKISDPNRPTWEQYKKENEEKLDMVGAEVRKMVEYRAELDRERESRLQNRLNRGKKSKAISDSESDSDSDDSDDHKRKDKKKHKKKDKKTRKHKSKDGKRGKDKKKKRKRSGSDDDEEEEDDDDSSTAGSRGGEREEEGSESGSRAHKKHRKHKKDKDSSKRKSGDTDSPVRLSEFMRSGYESD